MSNTTVTSQSKSEQTSSSLFPESILSVSQQELSETQMIVRGELPHDLSGHVFILAPVGHVDSQHNDTLVYPSQDGTPFFNGNAMIYRLDFDKPHNVGLKSKIAKTPCYYADEATKPGTKYQEYGFHNFGVARLSPWLGVRSVANTAIVSMKFGDENERLMVTCDVGRPYEIDTHSLDVVTPIGTNKEWREQLPLNLPFEMVMNTAHPYFDAHTNEMFTVNYGKSLLTALSPILKSDVEKLPHFVKDIITEFAQKLRSDIHGIKSLEIAKELHEILERLNKEIHEIPEVIHKFSQELRQLLKQAIDNKHVLVELLDDLKQLVHDGIQMLEGLSKINDFVDIIRWDGKSDFERWQVTLPDDSAIKIQQTIHQIGVTQDYVVLMDTGFKVGPEQLVTKPVLKNKNLENLIRELLDYPTLSETYLYIVRRADLKAGLDKVVAQQVVIRGAIIHFEVDYDNPQNQITLHVAHSGAWDVSEWLRDYDTTSGQNPHPPVGMVSGPGDIHPLGRYVIDVEKGEVVQSKVVRESELTWAIAINAYNKHAASKKVDNIYWNSWGCWADLLSEFSAKLYDNYQGHLTRQEVKEITKQGRPANIFRLVTDSFESMAIADSYKFGPGYFGNSPQFVPRTNSDGSSTDGYILCTVLFDNKSEIWIFDAQNLERGPVCQLSHPQMKFGFTTHTTWVPKIAPRTASYYISVREDLENLVNQQSPQIQKLFEEAVYPKFSLTGWPPVPKAIATASRCESNVKLNILESKLPGKKLPDGLQGHVFIMGPVGSVDSGGLPYPNHDPIFNSDGMVYRLDFNVAGEVGLKTKILKTPCYYADQATQTKTKYALYRFHNFGISRFSPYLGSRNQLNTAFVSFSGKEEPPRLLVTYDAGRPYEIDTETLEVVTPVGNNKEWCPEIPLNFPFPTVLSTAHPAFDANTHEMFTVNYGRALPNWLDTIPLIHHLDRLEENVGKFVKNVFKTFSQVSYKLRQFSSKLISQLISPAFADFVYLIRWDGVGELERWKLVLPDGTPVKIEQSLHEIGITRDYVVLIDTDFKVGIAEAFNNLNPSHPQVGKLLRKFLTPPVLPDTKVYIVRRQDLKGGQRPELSQKEVEVVARPLTIPQAGIHFILDYENPHNQITLYAAHNCADVDEWVRCFDSLAFKSNPVPPNLLGMLTTAFDVSRLGRYLIDVESGEILDSKVLSNTRHTWGVGLYTYRQIPAVPPTEVENIYWQSSGFWQDLLTKYIFDMYKDYKYRVIPPEKLLEIPDNPQSRSSSLFRLETKSMEIADFYEFPVVSLDGKEWDSHMICSPQFVPRANGSSSSTDGYIVCTVLSDKSEIWIFDANDLAQGPVCKLGHPSLDFAYTLHTAWLPKIAKRTAKYNCPVRLDYQDQVKKKSQDIKDLFEKEVYPHFEGDVIR